MSNPPKLSSVERMAALARASEYRRRRADFKAKVKRGECSWVAALESDDEALRRMRLRDLISALPGFGEVRASAVLDRAGISASRRVQGLGNIQRQTLEEILRGRI